MSSPRFAAPDPALTVSVPLDGMLALYHRASGQTHLLAEPLPDILEALAKGPLDAEALLDALGVEPGPPMMEALMDRLAELEASGLVERL